MNPELAQRLLELSEGRELRDFLLSEAAKLNRLDDIKIDDPQALALEAKSRQKAYETLMNVLSPLIENTRFDIMNEKDDSISSEMLLEERSQDQPTN